MSTNALKERPTKEQLIKWSKIPSPPPPPPRK